MFKRPLPLLVMACLVSIICLSRQGRYEDGIIKQELFYNEFSKSNTIFIIEKDYDFQGNTVIVGNGSTLSFQGGSFINAQIRGDESYILDNGNTEFFKNCTIEGSWKVKVARSDFFERTFPTEPLLLNLATLSDTIELSNNRTYTITKNRKCWLYASVLRGRDGDKPTLEFIYDSKFGTNLEGINLISDTVRYESLRIVDNFSPDIHKKNDQTLGSTLYAGENGHLVNYCEIVDCDFLGGTSSSFFSSSKVKNFYCHNCSFTGYMADHALYCSTIIEEFIVDSVNVQNVTYTAGLFKIRDCKPLKNYTLRNLSINNVQGYISIVSLNPDQVDESLLFENIVAENINLFSSTTTAEPSIAHNSVTIRNCILHAVGTNNRMLFNQGNYKPVLWSSIRIENCDIRNFYPPWENSCVNLFVSNCNWRLLDRAEYNQSVSFSRNVYLYKSEFFSERTNNIFFYDYKGLLKKFKSDSVIFNINSKYLFGFGEDNDVDICLQNSKIEGLKKCLFCGENDFPEKLNFRNINTSVNVLNNNGLVYPKKLANKIKLY